MALLVFPLWKRGIEGDFAFAPSEVKGKSPVAPFSKGGEATANCSQARGALVATSERRWRCLPRRSPDGAACLPPLKKGGEGDFALDLPKANAKSPVAPFSKGGEATANCSQTRGALLATLER